MSYLIERRNFLASTMGLLTFACSMAAQNHDASAALRRCYIYLAGGIRSDTGLKINDAITGKIAQGYREFYIVISSGGGIFYRGLGIYNTLMSLRDRGDINIITHNISHADSATAYIFLAGQTRITNRNATFLFHPPASTQKPSDNNADELNETFLGLQQISMIGAEILRHETRIPENVIRSFEYGPGDRVDAVTALNYGIVDRIQEFTMPEGTALQTFSDEEDPKRIDFRGFAVGPEIKVEFHKPNPTSFGMVPGPHVTYKFYL